MERGSVSEVERGCKVIEFVVFFFFFNDTATTEIYTLSLHDALPIWGRTRKKKRKRKRKRRGEREEEWREGERKWGREQRRERGMV